LFAALGDTTRLEIVSRLCANGPASITALTDGSGVTRQAVTKHLNVLSSAGLVRSAWRGRERVWEFEPKKLAEARAHLDAITQQWDDALGRLKAFVEKDR
jgi:DNA-binding transcriptional ArsR family regulator